MPLKHGMPKYNKKDLHSDAFQTFRSDIDLGFRCICFDRRIDVMRLFNRLIKEGEPM